ncbi:MAG: peptidylprolyl isomerase [Thermoleophilaceae bacterium]|nr:peptidylprolyl isomerase [Thermoleophilaceae bacterium]
MPLPRRPLAALICALALVPIACGGDDPEDETAAQAPATETSEQPATGCPTAKAPEPKQDGGAKPPAGLLDPGKIYRVTLKTTCGDMVIRLDQKTSPKTAASFVALVRSGFFEDTVFHRIVPGFVIQGGDPTGTGTGGPGYSTRDKPPADARYTLGTVAMAKSATEAPGTAGSQFYIVTAPDAGLPPQYALLGKVVSGLDVVRKIGELGDPASGDQGLPLQAVILESATVSGG